MWGEAAFFTPDARARVTSAIKEIETGTSAEVVVAVRNAAGTYRDVDYLVGFAASLGVLAVLLFHPYPFAVEGMPLGVIAGFIAGTALSANGGPLRRALVRPARREKACRDAGRAAFFELGIGRTRDRNGILVMVSLFERRVAVVADVGVDPAALGPSWKERVATLEGSLGGAASVERFLTALSALGPPLAAAMPRRADDVNELPDEVA
jgi:putative membrane protein